MLTAQFAADEFRAEAPERHTTHDLDPVREFAPEALDVPEWSAADDDAGVWSGALSERPRGMESALAAYRRRKAKRNAPEADRYTDDDLQALADYYIGA